MSMECDKGASRVTKVQVLTITRKLFTNKRTPKPIMIITISTQVMTLIILTITAPTMIPVLIIFITLIENISILDAHHETLNIMKILLLLDCHLPFLKENIFMFDDCSQFPSNHVTPFYDCSYVSKQIYWFLIIS